uniref:NFACT RNA-binding domain-containing protein n=1 Tax=Caenorhabditis japonica TaxID=281687 RepID=A0A8R1DTW2_CAEJA
MAFENNEFIISLSDPYDNETPPILVPIDISLTASKNAQRYFVDKKSAAEKVKKTVASSEKAIKNAQEKAKSTLEQVRVVVEVKKSRKAMWFEKFRWFVSSEGYVVVAGRDAQQNELLVKKYLRNGDIYVHADVRGASSVIIRNKTVGGADIPPKTLTEAAQMAVCYSNAWEAGVTAAAWWVRHEQVSRTAPTGEYLPSGSFMIRGKKNFMPPSQMVMGLGILFKMDDETTERHLEIEKAKKAENQLDTASPEAENPVATRESAEAAEEEFPDIQVNIGRTCVKDDEFTLIEVGPKLTLAQQKQQKLPVNPKEHTKKYLEERMKEELEANAGPSARTQKRRQRKEKLAKMKYKDQTDDDLELHKSLLKPQGQVDKTENVEAEKRQEKEKEKEKTENREECVKPPPKKAEHEEEEEEDDKEASAEEAGLLSSLTAQPLDLDTLLFAVPVVAPYSALAGYKYRVKITPGIGKRGKATKSAIELFTRQKTDRQAALIKSLLSDDSASRNLPTKVRISAPQLHAK